MKSRRGVPRGDAALAAAGRHYRSGDAAAATAACHRILSRQPRHTGALQLLGAIELQSGRPAGAVELFRQVVSADSGQAEAHLNLGAALLAAGRAEEALASFEQALQRQPALALGWTNRGNVLLSLGRPEAALASHRKALDCDPGDARAHCNLGNVLRELGRHDDALASYRRAWELRPDYVLALRNAASLYDHLGRPADSLSCHQRVARIAPRDTAALVACGNRLQALSRPGDAVAYFARALAIDANLPEALNNLGVAQLALDDPAAALESFDRALGLSSTLAECWNNRGEALRRLKRFGDAADCYARLVELAPQVEVARGKLVNARLLACDWSDHAALTADLERRVLAGERAAAPFDFLAVSGSAQAQLACAQRYGAAIGEAAVAPAAGSPHGPVDRIRVAYVSGDFRNHPLSHLLVGVLEQHDRSRFEILGISLRPEDATDIGQRVRRAFDRFIDVSGESDRDVIARLRDLDTHIAVDLMGFTQGSRPAIFAGRAAPLQLSYLGQPATLGSAWIDYLIADDYVVPDGSRQFYAEKVLALPDCFQANDDRRVIGAAPARAQLGLPDEGFVFCCFNTSCKLNPPLFDVWCRLIRAREGSVLWLVAETPEIERNLRREAERRGVDAGRLVFSGRVPYAQHLARQRRADLFLDTLPFNAGATASDALWAGLPVLTCAGEAFASRMAGSLLRAAGLPELITTSLADYERRALELSAPGSPLCALRARLERVRTTAPLFDTARFCRQLEAAYAHIRERPARGPNPASLTPSDR